MSSGVFSFLIKIVHSNHYYWKNRWGSAVTRSSGRWYLQTFKACFEHSTLEVEDKSLFQNQTNNLKDIFTGLWLISL